MTFPSEGVTHFITLSQPWATLMATDAKRNETRGWSTKFRGWIAIHAAKGFPPECRWLCEEPPYAEALELAGYKHWREVPVGRVLAVAELVDCVPTHAIEPNEIEWAFGNYSVGRFAFVTRGVRRLREPFEMKGALGIQRLPRPILESDLL